MKQILSHFGGCAPAALVAAATVSPALAADKLTIGLSTWVGYGPLFIARDEGFFKDEGLDVNLVMMEDVKTRMPALAAGRIDVATTTVDAVLGFTSPGHPLTYLFAVDDSRGGDGIGISRRSPTLREKKLPSRRDPSRSSSLAFSSRTMALR